MKKVVFFVIFSIFLGLWLIGPTASFAQNAKIVDYFYYTHFVPGETVAFSVSVRNNSNVLDNVYLDVVLTNQATGKEELVAKGGTDYYPGSDSRDISVGQTVTLTTDGDVAAGEGGANIARRSLNWTAKAGTYTVTLIIYTTAAGNAERHRVSGSTIVHVGTTKDSVAAFPKVFDLGTLQYGRYMHPVPIEISWDFYLRSAQLRKDHPWYMRIYTDNHKRYKGIYKAIYSGRVATQEGGSASGIGSPAGLVSSDGKYTIPLKVWCANFGPDVEDGWDTNLLGPPPVKEDAYWKGPLLDTGKRDWVTVAWQWIPDYLDMTSDPMTWRRLIGQDPFDKFYVSDSNPTGDFTLTSPFQLFVAYETSPTAVVGKYSTDLIIEIYSP